LAKVHEYTKTLPEDQVKLTETAEKMNETVIRIERNSEYLNIRLAAVEANTATIQTTMLDIKKKNRLHEIGTHVINIRTTELGKWPKIRKLFIHEFQSHLQVSLTDDRCSQLSM
jgi:hypothetical protein